MSENPPTPAPPSRRRSSAPPRSDARRAWIIAALLALALVLLPILFLLLIPTHHGFTQPPSSRSSATPEQEAPSPALTTKPTPPPRRTADPASTRPADAQDVFGTVLDEDGRPIEKATVACEDHDGETPGVTDADGHFKMAPEAAGCAAVARHPGSHLPSAKATLVAGRSNDFRLQNPGGIEGIVVDERGAPVDGALVAIETWTPAYEGLMGPTGRTLKLEDHTGAFRFEKLSPGRYSLTASGPGRPIARTDMIDVEASRVTKGVRITLLAAARLSGRVLDGDTKKPIANATIQLDTMTSTGAAATAPGKSDETGAFSLEVPPTGPFSVRAEHPQYRTKLVSGLVARGGAVSAEIDLSPRGDGGDSPELTGVGAILAPRSKGGIAIVSLVADGPATKAGVREGDALLKIDGVSVDALSVPDCVQRLRGQEGTRVTITIQRGDDVRDVSITRGKVSR